MFLGRTVLAVLLTLLSLLLLRPVAAWAAAEVPVLFTFDVESNEDVQAIPRLSFGGPGTWFVTGRFAEAHPELVRDLVRRGTVGSHTYSHPDLTKLDDAELERELLAGKEALARVTGQAPRWFRAPYLAYDRRVATVLAKLGFRYDSSSSERWMRGVVLPEMPIGTGSDEILVADYDLFEKLHLSDEAAAAWLEAQFDARTATGRPFVFLMHPRIIVRHLPTFERFVAYVRQHGGRLLSAEQLAARLEMQQPRQFAAWIDLSNSMLEPERVAEDLSNTGFTDVFLMAKDPEGNFYYPSSVAGDRGIPGGDRFGTLARVLKGRGLAVHAWLPVTSDARLARAHPEWAMVSQGGQRSNQWVSPSNPRFRAYFSDLVREIVTRYPVDGVQLDAVGYPSLDYDYSPAALAAFAADRKVTTVDPGILLSETWYGPWVGWRMRETTAFVAAVRQAVATNSRPGVRLSAMLASEAATSFEVMEGSGQDYGSVAGSLDLIVPMVDPKDEKEGPDRIGRVLFAAGQAGGTRPVLAGIAAYQQPGEWSYATAELPQPLGRITNNAAGFGIYLNAYPFGSGHDIPTGVAELVRDWIAACRGLPAARN